MLCKAPINLTDNILSGCLQIIEDQLLRQNPDRKDEHNERRKICKLTRCQILQAFVLGIVYLAEHRALVEPKQVGRAKHDPGHTKDTPPDVALEGAAKDQKLADESVQ